MEDRTRDSRSGWGAVGKGMVSTFDLDGVKLHAEKSLRLLCHYFPPTFTSHTLGLTQFAILTSIKSDACVSL